MPVIRCTSCSAPYPVTGTPYRCACGGNYDFDGTFDYSSAEVDVAQPGYWRYQNAFSLAAGAPVVTLGEGNTPLIWMETAAGRVGLKMESMNPTGSYKDRGSAVLVSQLLARGVQQAVEDSSGNAGASFAAYAARAGLQARVYVPESASGPKLRQIEQYGAELRMVPGPRAAAAAAVLKDAEAGIPYASHAYMPFGLAGIATIAYEIQMQAGLAGTIIAPIGHGGLLLGIVRGYQSLLAAGEITRMPYIVGVQAASCSPVVHLADRRDGREQPYESGTTIAEGVRVQTPVRGGALVREITAESGQFIAIEEREILPAYQSLAKHGIYVEPTSALVWAAYEKLVSKLPAPIILILTGSGLKYNL